MDDLKQSIADEYFKLEKVPFENKYNNITFPTIGNSINVKLFSEKEAEFYLDIKNSMSNRILCLKKITFQNRYLKTYTLRRIDLGNKPHKNPKINFKINDLLDKYNVCLIKEPHIHIYVEGFGDKWAIPLTEIENFKNNQNNEYILLKQFVEYCNIKCNISPNLENF